MGALERVCILIAFAMIMVAQSSAMSNLLDNLKNVTTTEEFLKLVHKDGKPITVEDVYGPQSGSDKAYISSGLRLALPDECSPRPMSVPIPRAEGEDHNVIYWPDCTRIERCGGCCPSEMLDCFPLTMETVEFHILRARIPFPGALMMDWEGPVPVKLQKHTSCITRCKLTRDMCASYQVFNEEECRCDCKEISFCPPYKFWDAKTCSCKCLDVKSCANFNHQTCRCDLSKTLTSLTQNITAEEYEEYERLNNITQSKAEAELPGPMMDLPEKEEVATTTTSTTTTTTTPTTTTTTTPTTTTTTTTAAPDPCATIWCPPMWKKRVNDRGNCVCRPPGMGRK